MDTEKLLELTVNNPPPSSSTPSSSSPKSKLSATNHLSSLFKSKNGHFKRYKSFFDELQGQIMEESLPKMVDDRVKELKKTQVPVYVAQGLIMEKQQSQANVAKMIVDVIQQERENLQTEISSDNSQLQQDDLPIWLALKYKFERLHVSDTPCRPSTIRVRHEDNPHNDAHPEGENDAKKAEDLSFPMMTFKKELQDGRANGSIVSITKPDYKNLNKNDIEDMYLLRINGKVEDYAQTGMLWSLSVFIKSTVIWERVYDFQLGVESYQHKKSKKEKRVVRHQEVHKFSDATLKKVLEGLKIYNNDVKHGYVTPSLSKEDSKYL
ncbi:hypothetical protein Tco_0482159 [Tanacetum coccineum]